MSDSAMPRRAGPGRPAGAPSGPDEVRVAILDAAATLFAERGVDAVSLRDVAEAAGVHLSLIRRYIGRREDLLAAVFTHVSAQLAHAVEQNQLSAQGFAPDTAMGRWVRIAASMVISGRPLEGRRDSSQVLAMAETLVPGLRPGPRNGGRLRAAQIAAAALGWRIFEDYLVTAGGLEAVPRATLRDELVRSARRLGSTPWPSPPDRSAKTR